MSFELGAPPKPPDEMFYERKSATSHERVGDDDAFPSDLVAHKDLFDTISEAHYLPDLSGPHDEALLESLVEKGCEDNQILDQALDKFAHLVHGADDYVEEEEDMLLGSGPVADIINRLENSIESPSCSSMTAAQGLLHLHHIGDHLPPQEHTQSAQQSYIADEIYTREAPTECNLNSMDNVTELQENDSTHHIIEYEHNAEKRLDSNIDNSNIIYTESVPDTSENLVTSEIHQQLTNPIPDPKQNIVASNNSHNHGCTMEIKATEETNNNTNVAADCDTNYQHSNTDMDCHENYQHTNTDVGCDENYTQANTDVDCDENYHHINTDLDCDKNYELTEEPQIILKEFTSNVVKTEEPTDLSVRRSVKESASVVVASAAETTNSVDDNESPKSDEQPKDLSLHRRLPTPQASPRRIEIPRAPSRESDAMQSPQPSGIPAVPSSPEIFTMPATKSKQTLFLETLLSSPSPKMYTSEVTITKHQCEPLNLGKHRKSASPTVSSCSDEMRKLNKEFGEPQEKRSRRESSDDLVKISKVFNKSCEEQKKSDRSRNKSPSNEVSAMKQLQALKSNPEFNLPDPLLVPKDKLHDLIEAPGKEIPALLLQRPELRLPDALHYPKVLQDPNIMVVSLAQLEICIENDAKKNVDSPAPKERNTISKTSSSSDKSITPQPDQTSQQKPTLSMDALAGDIDAATSAALNQMLWLPYLSQLEAMAACSQNMDFLKALNSSGYGGQNYPDISQMFNHSARFMGSSGFPMMPPMDYDNRLQFAMWQEAMNAATAQRSKSSAADSQLKDVTSKSGDVQNPYVHSTKSHQHKPHSAARTSPIAHSYNSQRSVAHNPFFQGMYPAMHPNMRANMPLPGLQIPYFNPNLMGSQRSPRTSQQKSPTSPYYPNNNYLQSVKQTESSRQRSTSTSSQESPRPRISVKSLQNLLEPTAAAASGMSASRRSSSIPPVSMGRRREEPEVGSTTPLGEPPPHLPPHPHDPSSFHLWHPLFGNQKGYNSPWSWTTVTATGD